MRRKSKKSKKIKRWLFLGLILSVAAHYGWKALSEFQRLNLNRNAVKINGNDMVSANKILTRLDLDFKKNILKINREELEEKLQNLDRIKRARVKRDFPNGLKIEVEEVLPVGYKIIEGRRFVVTETGDVFEGNEGPSVKFMADGKNNAAAIVRTLDIIKNTDKDFFSMIEAVDINYKDDIIIYLREGWFMKLPPVKNITEDKVSGYLDIAKQVKEKYKNKRNRFNYMDFRYIDFNEESIRGAVIVK
ncbi:MAG: FtsQ-type POTRA domain-containing protein [Elusimicrobia bacterium]|jgi:cell division septal protein FtsQ|nr:FtsQ-type POTRA domain-containing protein [Elusimicrobiota bacterium]